MSKRGFSRIRRAICQDYQNDNCKLGTKCRLFHPTKLCDFFMMGVCGEGKLCRNWHSLSLKLKAEQKTIDDAEKKRKAEVIKSYEDDAQFYVLHGASRGLLFYIVKFLPFITPSVCKIMYDFCTLPPNDFRIDLVNLFAADSNIFEYKQRHDCEQCSQEGCDKKVLPFYKIRGALTKDASVECKQCLVRRNPKDMCVITFEGKITIDEKTKCPAGYTDMWDRFDYRNAYKFAKKHNGTTSTQKFVMCCDCCVRYGITSHNKTMCQIQNCQLCSYVGAFNLEFIPSTLTPLKQSHSYRGWILTNTLPHEHTSRDFVAPIDIEVSLQRVPDLYSTLCPLQCPIFDGDFKFPDMDLETKLEFIGEHTDDFTSPFYDDYHATYRNCVVCRRDNAIKKKGLYVCDPKLTFCSKILFGQCVQTTT